MYYPQIFHFSPGRILLLAFLFAIGMGAFLLSLPQSRIVDISFIDLLFTSTSITCVTGLSVVPISYFSTFGKFIILCLIQVGGLGIITLSFFFISIFLELGMTTQLMAGEILEFKWWAQVKNYLALIMGITFVTELIGAILLFFPFSKTLPTNKAIFFAVFHSVSAFCNAGITLFDNGIPTDYQQPFSLLIISLLVFAGSIGFIVWFEVANKIKQFFQKNKKKHISPTFSLHTKIVLTTTALLIIAGTIATWLLEYQNSLKDLSLCQSFCVSFFNSISIRNAGFHVFNLEKISLATLLLFIFLMYIGASPGSTGSGIKTTTFTLFVATMATIIKNREDVELFGRTITQDQIYKAISIVVLSASWIMALTFMLLITEKKFLFIQIFFEAVSAFSTTGLSTGITPYFSSFGKILIMLTMIAGRIGSLTLVLALRKKKKKLPYLYPEERVVLG